MTEMREKQINLKFTEDEWERANRVADAHGLNLQNVVRFLLRQEDARLRTERKIVPLAFSVYMKVGRNRQPELHVAPANDLTKRTCKGFGMHIAQALEQRLPNVVDGNTLVNMVVVAVTNAMPMPVSVAAALDHEAMGTGVAQRPWVLLVEGIAQ